MGVQDDGRGRCAARRSRRFGGGKLPVVLAVAAAALLGVALSGAGPFGPGARAAGSGGSPSSAAKLVLRIGVTQDVNSMNPFVGFTDTAYDVYSQNYEFLVERRPEDYMPGPDGVAESWESSSDGKTWTFHLHKGITWQDGRPLTADDVVFTYNYIVDNQIPAYTGAAAGITKAVKVDDHTVQLVTSRPKADILSMWIPILPKHVWEKISPEEATASFENPTPIGSGPFQVVEWKRGSYVRMKANKNYWLGAPAVDEVIYQIYKNANTMVEDLVSGTIDCAQGIPPAAFRKLEATPGIKAIAYLGPGWDHMNFNCYDSPDSRGAPVLRDPRFRVALDYAIDRDKLVAIPYGGLAVPGSTVLPPGFWKDPDYHWQPPAGVLRTFDLARAGAMLDAAGYVDTDGDGVRESQGKPIKLRLWAPTGSIQMQTSAKLITGWFRELGLDIKYQVVDEGVINDGVWNYEGGAYAPDYDLYLWSWGGMADPSQTLDSYTTAQIEGWNEPCWSDAAYDRASELQMHELDAQKRAAAIDRCQEIMYAANPQAVTVYAKLLQAVNTSRWDGWVYSTIEGGQAFYRQASQKTFLTVRPKVGAQATAGSRGWIWGLVAIAGAIAIVVVVALRRRARGRVEEAD
ncbi:MAG: ABC transporter substrate-binding protein [Actinomycetes bacterium]